MPRPLRRLEGDGSLLVRRRLGAMLLKARRDAGYSRPDLQKAKIMGETKAWRLETGRQRPVMVGDIMALSRLYGLAPEMEARLLKLAENCEGNGWIEDFGTSAAVGTFSELEAETWQVEAYEPEIIYGALQTPAYARAVLRTAASPGLVDSLTALRMERLRKALDRGCKVRCILGEAALRLGVGSEAVMVDQVAHLKHLGDTFDIVVRPFLAGPHQWMNGPFTILDFQEPDDPSVVYTETHTGCRYFESKKHLKEYREAFRVLHSQSTPIKEWTT